MKKKWAIIVVIELNYEGRNSSKAVKSDVLHDERVEYSETNEANTDVESCNNLEGLAYSFTLPAKLKVCECKSSLKCKLIKSFGTIKWF